MQKYEEELKEETTVDISDAICFLVGIIPNENMSLEDYREERLVKYETAD